MPVLHERTDRTGYYLVTTQEGREVSYALAPEAERFLMLVLGVKSGETCRPADLNLMVERGWAKPIVQAVEPEPAPAPVPVPAPVASPAEPVARVLKVASPEPVAPRPVAVSASEKVSRTPATRRSRGREVALQLLYQLDQNPGIPAKEVSLFLNKRLTDPKLIEFTRGLVEGVQKNQANIDERIGVVAENWRLDRMATIDRNILRLGAYELLFCDDIPAKVAINEALELAKRYSTSQSSRFVNGVLDRIRGGEGQEPVSVDDVLAAPGPAGVEPSV